MSVESRSDSGCCLSDGDFPPYKTSAEHSRPSRSPLDSRSQPAPLQETMNSPPIRYLKDEKQAKNSNPRTVSRRHGACNPCKASKTKCDGAEPCGACRSEKRKSRICEYSEKAKGIALARQEGELRKAYRHQSESTDSNDSNPRDHHIQNLPSYPSSPRQRAPFMSNSSILMHGRLSLCRVVDEFIKVKTARPQAQLHVRSVQSQWTKQQEPLFKDFHNNNKSRGPMISTERSAAMDDEEHTDGHIGIMSQWRTEFNLINEKINNGNLASAWISIPTLMRAMEAWEASHTNDPWEGTGGLFHEVASMCGRLLEVDAVLSFFLGGRSLLLSTWQRSNFLRPKIEYNTDTRSRLEVFHAITQVLEVDVSNEPGIWDFLRLHKSIKDASPATLLEKVATCTTDKEPFGAQEMKLYSNLLFVMNYCRTASICGHYSHNECTLPPANTTNGDIVREMKLSSPRQRGNECTQANKYAGIAMKAFEALYEIDKETLAQSWLLLYGGLTAAIIYQIHGLREKGVNWGVCKEKIDRVQDCFSGLQEINPGMPLINMAITILSERDPKKSQSSGGLKTKAKPSLTHQASNSSSDESIEASEPPMQDKSGTIWKPSSGNKRSIDEVAGAGSSTKTKVRKTAKHKAHNLESATSSFEGHDSVTEPQSMFGYNNAFQIEAPPYDESFTTSFDEHAPYTSGTTTPFATTAPRPAAMSEPPTQGWFYPENERYSQWSIGHPPMVIPEPSPALIPFALEYNGYDLLNHRWPTRFGSDEAMKSQQDLMPPAASMQQTIPSPASLQQPQQAQQASAPNATESPDFFHMTPKHFERKNADDATSGLTRPQNSQLLRGPTEQMIPTTESMISQRLWHDDQEHGGPHPNDAEYQSNVLQPRPEMPWLQSEHHGSSSHPAYYPLQHQQFHDHHGLQYSNIDPSMNDHNDMHQTRQTHQHHFPITTMSS